MGGDKTKGLQIVQLIYFYSVFLSNVFLLGIASTWLYTSCFLRSKKNEINGDVDFNEWLAWTISASVFFVIAALAGVAQMFITNRFIKFAYIGFLTVGFVLYCIAMLLAYDSVYFNVYKYFNIGVVCWVLQTFSTFQGIINAIQL